ncbi:MAG: hypothetical protein FJ098_03370, partial [Deltaproteobacteria bacterium]|nr:hypothetical protein [Deltaproteobacteria bacterium]
MKTIVNPLLRCLPLLLAACTGGGGAGPGADGRGSADGRGVDAEEPPADAPGTDWFHEEDRRRPPPEGRLALRFEVRFGTTDAWKGLSLLAPSGLYHTEAADVGACAGSLDDMFLSQLEGAVDAADPWSWGAAGRTGTACGSQAFRYVLHLEDLFDGLSMDSDWCGPDEDAVPGRAEIVKKIQMLNAWVDQNGDCGVMPRILGKPVAVAAAGLDDGTGTGFAVARFEDPDFCTIAYITYTGEVYRSNRPIDMDQDTADAVAAGMAPVEGDLKTLATEICPEAAEFMFSPAVLADNGLEAVVAVVGQGPSGPAAWLAVGGLATLVLPAEAPDGHM